MENKRVLKTQICATRPQYVYILKINACLGYCKLMKILKKWVLLLL
jgi:hypothetical protein